MRVVAEHTRAATFLITDGVTPSNEGRGYVLRRILRRAVYFLTQLKSSREPMLNRVAEAVIERMERAYPDLHDRAAFTTRLLAAEESKFRETLDRGRTHLDEILRNAAEGRTISAAQAFTLYDTFGYPLELHLRDRRTPRLHRRRCRIRARDGGAARARPRRREVRVRGGPRRRIHAARRRAHDVRRLRHDRARIDDRRHHRRKRRAGRRRRRRRRRGRAPRNAVLPRGRRPGRRQRRNRRAAGPGHDRRHAIRGRRPDRAPRPRRERPHRPQRRRHRARRSAAAPRQPAQPHRDAPAARRPARGARHAREAGRLARRARPPALRLHAHRGDEARGTRRRPAPGQREDPRRHRRPLADRALRARNRRRRDGALRRKVHRRCPRRRHLRTTHP